MKMLKSHFKFVFSLLVSLLMLSGLFGCHAFPAYVVNPTLENLTSTERQLLRDTEHTGIQVIKQGMVFTFVIPTDCFFMKDTRELKSHREKDLDRLAQFLDNYSSYFSNPHIYITGYTDKTWLSPARDLLSLHYAETIATYFREDGLDSKVVLVVGDGAKHPIASNRYPMGTAFNRRVVITIK